uniref:Integrase zinc-binding domain-containing protein n=1 Tax=Clastoptera arizonana TaxID=38151 RepID=A0A1B6CFF8_9HEMI
MTMYLRPESSLQLKRLKLPGTDTTVYCDVSMAAARPYLTKPFRRTAFNIVQGPSHPGSSATVKQATQSFVWPSINKDCKEWAKSCKPCQQSKVSRHVTSPLASFAHPSGRFKHVHVDKKIPIDRLKPAYVGAQLTQSDHPEPLPQAQPLPDPSRQQVVPPTQSPQPETATQRRSGRRVRFAERY